MVMKTKNERQRVKALQETLSYAIANEFNPKVIAVYQEQVVQALVGISKDKEKRRAFRIRA